MRRDADGLVEKVFDVLVVGAGIHGACIARDAARRGLDVALIERSDFGAATSHNSLKIIHGGVRYCQHLDLSRMRTSLIERSTWLRIAPHLTRVLRFVVPTHGRGARSRAAFATAFALHDLIGADRNVGLLPGHRVPRSRTAGRGEACEALPWLDAGEIGGAAIWYDGQMDDPHRLLLECVLDAVEHGAQAANHVEALEWIEHGGDVLGARVRDRLSNDVFEVRARTTVNATGPWMHELQSPHCRGRARPGADLVKNMNLVLRSRLADHAFGFYSTRPADSTVGSGRRLYFLTPWADCTIVGTSHVPFHGNPGEPLFTDDDVGAFANEIREGVPGLELDDDDLICLHAGLTPGGDTPARGAEAARARRAAIVDHAAEGQRGLVSVAGVKYTTARAVAEHVVDRLVERDAAKTAPCTTASAPLPGARGFESVEQLVKAAAATLGRAGLDVPQELELERVARAYGARFALLVKGSGAHEARERQLLAARVQFAVEHEMAVKLDDVLLRRLDISERGKLDKSAFELSRAVMADMLKWTPTQLGRETDDLIEGLKDRKAKIVDDDRHITGSVAV